MQHAADAGPGICQAGLVKKSRLSAFLLLFFSPPRERNGENVRVTETFWIHYASGSESLACLCALVESRSCTGACLLNANLGIITMNGGGRTCCSRCCVSIWRHFFVWKKVELFIFAAFGQTDAAAVVAA